MDYPGRAREPLFLNASECSGNALSGRHKPHTREKCLSAVGKPHLSKRPHEHHAELFHRISSPAGELIMDHFRLLVFSPPIVFAIMLKVLQAVKPGTQLINHILRHAWFYRTPSFVSTFTSSGLNPKYRVRMDSLCSPTSGEGRSTDPGVSDILNGTPGIFAFPMMGCSTSTK